MKLLSNAPNYDEEGLAVATPVSPEDDQPIYQAEKYTPEAKIPFYKRGRHIFWTIVALLVIGVVVALAVVYGTKGAVEEEQTLPPTISKRDTKVMSVYRSECAFTERNLGQFARKFSPDLSFGVDTVRRT